MSMLWLSGLIAVSRSRTCADYWYWRYHRPEGPRERLKIEIPGEDDVMPLHVAASHGDLVKIRELAKPETINVRDGCGRTPLFRAFSQFRRHEEAVRLLLELGADPNVEGCDGATALHAAATAGSSEMIVLMVKEYEAKLDKQTDPTVLGQTPLLKALEHAQSHIVVVGPRPPPGDHFGAVRRLVELGANVSTRDASGESALEYAMKVNEEMVKLIEGARVK